MLVKHQGKYMALKSLSKQQILDMGLQVGMLANWLTLLQRSGLIHTYMNE